MAAATVQRRKEPLDRLRESEASPGSPAYAGPSHPEDAQRPRMTPPTVAAKVNVDDADRQAEDIKFVYKAMPVFAINQIS